LGGIAGIGGADDGVWGCAPGGVQGTATAQGVWDAKPPEAGSFMLRK